MKGSVYSMIGHPATHAAGERAAINHHLSHDLQEARSSSRQPLLYSRPVPSVLPSLAAGSCLLFLSVDRAASLSAPEQTLSEEVTVGGGGRPRCRNQFGVAKEIDLVLNEASVLLSREVTAPFVIIGPPCHSHTPHNSRRLNSN